MECKYNNAIRQALKSSIKTPWHARNTAQLGKQNKNHLVVIIVIKRKRTTKKTM